MRAHGFGKGCQASSDVSAVQNRLTFQKTKLQKQKLVYKTGNTFTNWEF